MVLAVAVPTVHVVQGSTHDAVLVKSVPGRGADSASSYIS